MQEGLYIHIPYCRKRCLYCGFYSCGLVQARWDDYIAALGNELSSRLAEYSHTNSKETAPFQPSTLYIGGGTPSLIPSEHFLKLIEILDNNGISIPNLKEFTLEVNPEDVDREMAKLWAQTGVNRISMGVQSLIDTELKALGRRHTAADARKAYDVLSERFDNISLDLMFGLPGQTLNSLRKSIDAITALEPAHISLYSLQYEERTALTHLRDRGEIKETDDDITIGMFQSASRLIKESGYEQYEISNYAKPGARSIHNSSYWQGMPYIGLGPSAHSYDGNRRRRGNYPDVKRYMDFYLLNQGKEEPCFEEILTEEELKEEYVMTRIRTIDGLSKEEIILKFGTDTWQRIRRNASPYIASGCLTDKETGISLASEGVMNSDAIILDLIM